MIRSEKSKSRLAQWRGFLGLAVRRLVGCTNDSLFNRVTATIGVVAITVALLVLVTGISLSLASASTVQSNNVDYWIVPESANTMTTAVSVQGPQFGDAHQANEKFESLGGVTASTPILIDVIRLRTPNSEEPEYILGIGIIPEDKTDRVGGLSTGALESGDPHYASGDYDGPMTGEIVLSPAAAEILNASRGEEAIVGSPATGEIAKIPRYDRNIDRYRLLPKRNLDNDLHRCST